MNKSKNRGAVIGHIEEIEQIEARALERLNAEERERIGQNWPTPNRYAVGDVVVWRPRSHSRSYRMRVTAQLPRERYQGKCVEPDRDFAHVMKGADILRSEGGGRHESD